MFCLNPMLAQRLEGVKTKVGKDAVQIVGSVYSGDSNGVKLMNSMHDVKLGTNRFLVPCGQCLICRLRKAKDWATRCVLESRMYEENMFLTLTYNDEHVPKTKNGNLTLCKEDVVKFLKRLRKHADIKDKQKLRFYMCGEYGEQYLRPHYHLIIFGYKFKDLEVWRADKGLFRSKSLEKLWKFGYSTVGSVSFDSCMYVARYVLKKQTGEGAKVYDDRLPEYNNMSRMPGIGFPFLEKYGSDVYNVDKCVINSKLKVKPPAYFDKKFSECHGEKFEKVKSERLDKAIEALGKFIDEDTGEVMPFTMIDAYRDETMRELQEIRLKNKERFLEKGEYNVKIFRKNI